MSAENIFGMCIGLFVAAIMFLIGIVQYNRKEAVGFYNVGEPPKSSEITDVRAWNHFHGAIWICYGIIMAVGFIFGVQTDKGWLCGLLIIGSVILPLPFMILAHSRLEKRYHIKTNIENPL